MKDKKIHKGDRVIFIGKDHDGDHDARSGDTGIVESVDHETADCSLISVLTDRGVLVFTYDYRWEKAPTEDAPHLKATIEDARLLLQIEAEMINLKASIEAKEQSLHAYRNDLLRLQFRSAALKSLLNIA